MYTVIYEATNTGFSAWVDGFPIYTTAESLDELRVNAVEGINLWREAMDMNTGVGLESVILVAASEENAN
jgi:predicted RNase H-like HicB family nuclease